MASHSAGWLVKLSSSRGQQVKNICIFSSSLSNGANNYCALHPHSSSNYCSDLIVLNLPLLIPATLCPGDFHPNVTARSPTCQTPMRGLEIPKFRPRKSLCPSWTGVKPSAHPKIQLV